MCFRGLSEAERGMLIVETIAKIRRLHFTEGKGIKTICRDLKLSKKVVRKVIRTGITEFTYSRTVQPRPKLGAWLEELSRLLAINAARGRRERLARPKVVAGRVLGQRDRFNCTGRGCVAMNDMVDGTEPDVAVLVHRHRE